MEDEYWNALSGCYISLMRKDCEGSSWTILSFDYGEEIQVISNDCSYVDNMDSCYNCSIHIEKFKSFYLEYNRREEEREKLVNKVDILEERIDKILERLRK